MRLIATSRRNSPGAVVTLDQLLAHCENASREISEGFVRRVFKQLPPLEAGGKDKSRIRLPAGGGRPVIRAVRDPEKWARAYGSDKERVIEELVKNQVPAFPKSMVRRASL